MNKLPSERNTTFQLKRALKAEDECCALQAKITEKSMGQAKARGSKDQRVTEAVERARVAEAIQKAQAQAERKATAERLAARQAAWEKDAAERLARGVKPAIRPPLRGRLNTSTLLAVAALGMLAQR